MKKIYLLAVSSALAMSLTGCATALQSHASSVIVSPNAPPSGCHYLGQVTGNQGNMFTGPFTSNANMAEGAMNSMKNQASAMGANYVQLLSTQPGNTGTFGSYGGSMTQTNVTDTGNAYVCPDATINE